MLSVIIPASNEEAYIGPCLDSLLGSDPVPGGAEAIVVANGCRDATVSAASARAGQAAARGWTLTVLDLPAGSKPLALNAGDAAARGQIRAYLDADVRVSPPLMAEIAGLLAGDAPRYASGRPVIPRAQSALTRAYAAFWQTLPFNQTAAPGYGLFAVNAAGRARWGAFPSLLSDDTFVRLNFAPAERLEARASYEWPMIEGFAALTRVRRRQDAGVQELERLHPHLMGNEGKPRLGAGGLVRRALRHPAGFLAYAAVSLAVRLGRKGNSFTRGR